MATARRAFAGPLNFVDTSNGYGLSEERLGTALAELGGVPEGLLLATKVDPEESGPFDGRRVLALTIFPCCTCMTPSGSASSKPWPPMAPSPRFESL
jgi:hypothetical protein